MQFQSRLLSLALLLEQQQFPSLLLSLLWTQLLYPYLSQCWFQKLNRWKQPLIDW
jgi:hypothetical protein